MRKLALAVAVAMASTRVYALGLGDIELHSALNEPLNADVRLLSAQPGELGNASVRLAPNDEFARAGIERPAILSDIKFTIVPGKNGTATLKITSTQPIREPFLDFIVQLNWQSGRLLREYTLLLDPPVFGEEQKAPVAAPVAEAPAKTAAPASSPTPMAATAVASPTPAAVPQQVSPTTDASGGNEIKSRLKSDKGSLSYGPTQRNDTLWNIATNLRPDESVSVYQMMLALLKENPEAFYENNVNGLKAGYVLRVPEKSAVMAIDEAQAVREAARQYERWQQSRRGSATTGEAAGATPAAKSGQVSQQTGTATQDKESARLRLVAPGDVSAKTGGGAGGTQEELDKLRGELAIAMESSDTAKRESDELRSRVSALEDQINSMQRLLTLKDESLNELQKRSGMTATQPPAGANTPAVAVPLAATVNPTPAKPAPTQPAAPKAKESMDLFADPTLMAAAGGAALLLLSVLWLVMRRRRNDEEVEPVESVEDQDVLPVVEDQPAQEERMEIADVAELGDTQEMTEVAEEVAHDAEQDIPQTASDLDVLHTPEGDIDPIVEADVYLAYRRYQQAEALIQNALAKQPGRQDLQAKLLEIYYASKNAESFQKVAQSLYESIGANDDDALWQRILPMGRELCPDHTLFNPAGGAGHTADKGALFDEASGGLDDALSSGEALTATAGSDESFDLNIGDEAADAGSAEGDQAAVVASQDEKMEFDLNLGEESLGGVADAASQEVADQTSEPLQAESDFASQTAMAQEVDGTAEAKEERAAEDGDRNKSWEIEPAMSDFGNIDFGLDDADLLAGTDVVGTKLDLARAYIDMGDNDSARDILSEVIEEGNDQQKQEAKGLVEKIA
jgi:pilus assembly protein FimV